ncbi:hypothetical protein U1763_12960 [Sphingomonas sp. LB2R24]|uniref:hypothetical protein n=1 Tax=Sphingomonas sorbitolis TaxID=3096165 RepID=UPI002FCC6539
MILLLVLLQAAASAPPARPIVAPPPPSWSILNPPARPGSSPNEVIVCGGKGASEQRLPLPGERPPQDRPRQPTGDPRAALDNSGPVCPPGGCTGVDLFTVPVVLIRGIGALIDPHSCCENNEGKDAMALVRDVGRKFRKKPDKSNRVPIVLDDPVK